MLEIRYFEDGWSGYIRDNLAEGPGGECWGLLERVLVDEIMKGDSPILALHVSR